MWALPSYLTANLSELFLQRAVMGLVSFVFCTIGKCIDVVCFLLDLNFWVMNSLIRLLVSLISFVNNLPSLMLKSLEESWSLTLFWMLTASEGLATAAQGAMGGVSESFKMAGHLSSYVLMRTKELLQRGVLSGHCLLRQLWEVCSIALSLSLYLINTMVNMLLLATQSCYSSVVWVLEVACGPLQKAVELALALLTFLYSSLLGTTVLLWTPCQLALEFLCSLSHVFVSVFVLNAYGLALTMTIIATATLYLNADLPLHGIHRALGYISHAPVLCRLRRALCRLYPLALERAQTVLEMGVWLRRGVGAAEGQTARGNDEIRLPALSTQQGLPTGGGTAGGSSQQKDVVPALSGIPLGDSSVNCHAHPADNLLNLLKEQEERKKCVICQDKSKTVLLLPCRHLCLCRDCADLLLRQPIYRHNCPLCRRIIIQTMDVYL